MKYCVCIPHGLLYTCPLYVYIKRSWKRLSANSSRARNQIATKPPQRFGTPTVDCPWGGDVCTYASTKECATKRQKTTVRHFGFMKKVYRLPCKVCMATAAMLKWPTALSCMTRDAKCKKASHCEKDLAQQVQGSLNSVLTLMQGATCTNVCVAVVNTPPGQQLQVATFGMPESPPEQPVQTRQEPMHTGMSAAPEKSVNNHGITPKHYADANQTSCSPHGTRESLKPCCTRLTHVHQTRFSLYNSRTIYWAPLTRPRQASTARQHSTAHSTKQPWLAAHRYDSSLPYTTNQGGMSAQPTFCRAKRWALEPASLCCCNGKDQLDPLRNPPEPLKTLYLGETCESKHFLQHTRKYSRLVLLEGFCVTGKTTVYYYGCVYIMYY